MNAPNGHSRFLSAVPQFGVADVVRTAEYYRDVLGFTIQGYWNGERRSFETNPPPVFGIVKRDDVFIYFNRAEAKNASRPATNGAANAYLNVTDVDALAAELRANAADILDGPEDRVYMQREIVIRDCNNLILILGEDTSP